MDWRKVMDKVMYTVFAVAATFLVSFLAASAVYIPAALIAEKECLEQGFPMASVAYNLDTYCINFDGDSTFLVEKQ